MLALAELFVGLLEGRALVLDRIQNQQGTMIEAHELRFENGAWVEGELNCSSAADFGLGTCACNSHPAWVETTVDRYRALELVRQFVENHADDVRRRDAETAWLESAIAELQAV